MSVRRDGAVASAARSVLREHKRFRRRAYSTLGRTAGVTTRVEDAADLLADRIEAAAPALLTALTAGSGSRDFRHVRNTLLQRYPTSREVVWEVDKVRGGVGVGAPFASESELVEHVYTCSERYRAVIRDTRDAPRRVKKARRDAARDCLAANLCGFNYLALAIANAALADDFAVVARAALCWQNDVV